ncbi:MAG: energy-coupling factor ABC transporter permease [Rhodoferax sp.]|nr:energy-coupling factor ABC transporter permease [Rhodoferax sp.]
MHMADALLSPAVGATFWLASGATLAWSARQVRKDKREYLVPLMGILGAFVFAAMMVNFTIPGTGSSGHLGGGLLLSILLGPSAAFIVMASVLTVQALFFADGGILALGTNIFNLGFCTCFVAYPLIYRPLLARAGATPSRRRASLMAVLAAVIGLQLGALGVVAQTQLSGISSLPLSTFLWLMQPMHLAIGVVEGLVTAALIVFVRQSRPDLLMLSSEASQAAAARRVFPRRLIATLGVVALATSGGLSWFASSQPDGLEWSIARTTGHAGLASPHSKLHAKLSELQNSLSLFVDYKLKLTSTPAAAAVVPATGQVTPQEAWPAGDASTSLAGLIGGVVTFTLVLALGYVLRRKEGSAA